MMEEIIDGQEDEEGGKIESISKKKVEDLMQIIRKSGMQSSKKPPSSISSKRQEPSVQVQSLTVDNEEETNKIQSSRLTVTSITADELSKLARLRDQGVITETEFVKMKGNLIDGT